MRITSLIARIPADVVDPNPEAPPGSDAFATVIDWVMWAAVALGIFGLLAAVILIFVGVIDSRSSQGLRAFLIVCAGLALLGAVGQIANALT